MKKVVVIGAGPAGMMAAATAANRGLDVTLIEKNHRVGRKILITGKGRCNITNDCDIEELIENVPTNGKFLYSAFYTFTNTDVIDMFNKLGVETKTERGKRVRYGRVFRGSEMNGFHNIVIDEAGMNLATDLLGITVDLDLRTEEESQGITSSPLGSEVEYIRIPVNSYADYDGSQSLEQIVDLLLDQETMYIHCWGGCDRTGTICWLLLGVLGVPEEELIKDYELSSFSIFGVRDSNSKKYLELKNKIDSYTGKTLQNKIENYFIECGVSAKKIEQLRATLLEERTTMD